MQVSFNEIETTLRKAAVGAGVDEGTARELAAAGRWLSERGVDGAAAVLASLTSMPGPCRSNLIRISGPGTMDRALVSPGVATRIEGCDVPLALLGLCGAAADQFGIGARLQGAGWSAVVSDRTLSTSGVVPRGPADIDVVVVAEPIHQPGSTVDRPTVEAEVWAALEELAARTYVPSSPESAASAGPGHQGAD